MVGEGVLLECFENPVIESVLVVSRRSCGHTHPKLRECLVRTFATSKRTRPNCAASDPGGAVG